MKADTSVRGGVTGWHKSSYSATEDNHCVEQGVFVDGRVAVRDTKFGDAGEVAAFEASDWKAFIASL